MSTSGTSEGMTTPDFKSIKLLCFDLDGTLIDSASDIHVAVNRTLAENARAPLTLSDVKKHIGEGLMQMLKDLFPDIQDPFSQRKLVERFREIYFNEELLKTTCVFDGVEGFLETWTEAGGRIGIITNKDEAPAKKLITHLELDRFPWLAIYGADTWSERKPSPLPLRKMMALAGVEPHETLMIGDGTPDLISAHAAGVPSVALDFGYTHISILNNYNPLASISSYAKLREFLPLKHSSEAPKR